MFKNTYQNISLKSYFDSNQNIWFKGKEVPQFLGYHDTDQSLRKHVNEEDKKTHPGRRQDDESSQATNFY